LGEILGLKTTDSKELLQFLQNLSAEEIVTGLHNALTDEVMVIGPTLSFKSKIK
jgi:uncharacterized protein YihD (DUF1040 family)